MVGERTSSQAESRRQPVVSVIVPTYNYERFLKECLQSVFGQTFRDFEVIVIDDGSTDETQAVLQSVSDPRLSHFRIDHRGISAARNFGIKQARGEFIGFIDADDRWRVRKLEAEIAFMRAEPTVGAVFSDFVRFTDRDFLPNQFTFYAELPSVPTRKSADGHGKVILGDAFRKLILFGEYPAYLQVVLFRSQYLRDIEIPEDLSKSEDLYLAMRAYERCNVGYLPEVTAELRRHGSNISKDVFEIAEWHLQALLHLEVDVFAHHRQAVRCALGRKCAALGYRWFREKRLRMAARYYLRTLQYPGRRLNALLHLAALPALPLLPKANTMG
jgi:glycosyltransferase involved in cell wall biosynthesis